MIRAAYQRSYARVWGTLRSLCVEAIGNANVVDVLGPNTLTHVVSDMAQKADGVAAQAAMRAVAEARARLHPRPATGTINHPVFDLFWTLSGEMPALEADLAESFGLEDAKRLAYATGMCAGTSTFGRPSKPAP